MIRVVGNRRVQLEVRIARISGRSVDVEWRHVVEGVEFGPWRPKTLELGDTVHVSYEMHINQPAMSGDWIADLFERLRRST